MQDQTHALYLRDEIVTNEVQHDLDKLGIAKTAREEKARARDKKAASGVDSNRVKNDAAYDARMAQLYREVVLKEKPATSNEGGFIPLNAITGAIAPANGNGGVKKIEEVGEPVAGD
jgi:tetraether lipid synthase